MEAIITAVEGLPATDGWRNVKPLINHQYMFRLRVGRFRVFFDLEQNEVKIYLIQEVKKREMSAHIEPQIIMQNGKPAFAVIPWEEYQKLTQHNPDETDVWIPHEVVKANVINGATMIRSWREYLGMTQQELARKAGMTQPALARLEKSDSKPRIGTLRKIAAAMDITVEQLTD